MLLIARSAARHPRSNPAPNPIAHARGSRGSEVAEAAAARRERCLEESVRRDSTRFAVVRMSCRQGLLANGDLYRTERERERGWDKRRRLTHGCIRWSGFGGCPGQDWVRDGRGHLPDVQLTVEGASSQARRPSRYLGRHHPRATVLGDHKDRRVTGVPAVRMRNSHPVACQGYDEEEDNQSVGAAGHDLSCRHEAGLYPCSHAAAEGL